MSFHPQCLQILLKLTVFFPREGKGDSSETSLEGKKGHWKKQKNRNFDEFVIISDLKQRQDLPCWLFWSYGNSLCISTCSQALGSMINSPLLQLCANGKVTTVTDHCGRDFLHSCWASISYKSCDFFNPQVRCVSSSASTKSPHLQLHASNWAKSH